MAYRVHDAQWYGVPQRRRRISVVADFGGSTAHEILFEPCSVSGNPTESGAQGKRPAGAAEGGTYPAVARSLTARYDGSPCVDRGPNIICANPWDGRAEAAAQTAVIPINDKATRYEGGGDTRKNDGAGNGLGVGKDGDPAPTLTSADKHIVAAFKSGQGVKAGGIGYQEEVSPTLSAVSSGTNQIPAILDIGHRYDAIRECGQLVPTLQARMGTGGGNVPLTYAFQSSSALSASDVASTQSARQYKSPTDLICTAVDCRNFTGNGNINGTLQAKESGGSSLNLNSVCRQSGAVRRLTPLECTRLQGFPDRWVDIGKWTDEKGRVHKEADAPKYKALGNSIALPFWKWLLHRISEYLPEGATLGSLFDGIGGFPLCWAEIHGAENCRWASEIEQFPIAVVKRHFGDEDAGIVGDVDKFLREGN
nr:MAG TPA: Cytosine specific methyltransferase [Caudoviricetes sp.]